MVNHQLARVGSLFIAVSSLLFQGFAQTREMNVQGEPSSQQRTGRVVGTAIDNEAMISGATVKIESNELKLTTITDQAGRYEFIVPAGNYLVTADVPGFYPFRRATFRVQDNTTTVINIVPVWRYISISLVATDSGISDRAETVPPPKSHLVSKPVGDHS